MTPREHFVQSIPRVSVLPEPPLYPGDCCIYQEQLWIWYGKWKSWDKWDAMTFTAASPSGKASVLHTDTE